MSYKTDKPQEIQKQIKEDEVQDELSNLGNQVLCLVCQRDDYTRVYIAAPRKKILSVTIDDADKFRRTMETTRVTNQYRAQGAKVEMNFG